MEGMTVCVCVLRNSDYNYIVNRFDIYHIKLTSFNL